MFVCNAALLTWSVMVKLWTIGPLKVLAVTLMM
jgi:hypothetical protein